MAEDRRVLGLITGRVGGKASKAPTFFGSKNCGASRNFFCKIKKGHDLTRTPESGLLAGKKAAVMVEDIAQDSPGVFQKVFHLDLVYIHSLSYAI